MSQRSTNRRAGSDPQTFHISALNPTLPRATSRPSPSAANMIRGSASSENVQRLIEQYAELMTLLNEKMVAWDETLVRCEQVIDRRAGTTA